MRQTKISTKILKSPQLIDHWGFFLLWQPTIVLNTGYSEKITMYSYLPITQNSNICANVMDIIGHKSYKILLCRVYLIEVNNS